ncbi:Chromatin-remodeling complex subunit ies6 [Cucumispora dikerogammari]|nr:Chromatin-remodeling complex subunit ies6 [Cucumispora dikerogammari]
MEPLAEIKKIKKNFDFSHIENNIRSKIGKPLKLILIEDMDFITEVVKYSTKPRPAYCDITGLPTQYLDPDTNCYYYNKDIYDVIKRKSLAFALQWQALKDVHLKYFF